MRLGGCQCDMGLLWESQAAVLYEPRKSRSDIGADERDQSLALRRFAPLQQGRERRRRELDEYPLLGRSEANLPRDRLDADAREARRREQPSKLRTVRE